MTLPKDITQLLTDWNKGDRVALDKLMPLVYDELRHIASRHLRRCRPDNIIQTTVLVHEAFLRLVDQKNVSFQNRVHFFAVASKAIRQILINYAVARAAAKRSGGYNRLSISKAMDMAIEQEIDILALDDALKVLAAMDERKSEIIELRFFGGLTLEETAEALGISIAIVRREWKLARGWLLRELGKEGPHDT